MANGYRRVVRCDTCNRDYTDSSESGGYLTEGRSWAICPKCINTDPVYTPTPSDILCPAGLSFYEFILLNT